MPISDPPHSPLRAFTPDASSLPYWTSTLIIPEPTRDETIFHLKLTEPDLPIVLCGNCNDDFAADIVATVNMAIDTLGLGRIAATDEIADLCAVMPSEKI